LNPYKYPIRQPSPRGEKKEGGRKEKKITTKKTPQTKRERLERKGKKKNEGRIETERGNH
jgi:hypothetical protein